MNYHNITHNDMNNGDGLRVVLWLSGCSHHCKNCQNPQTWNSNSGIIFDENAKNEIFNELSKDYISGITFSGGDPLYKDNVKEVLQLIKEMKNKFPKKTIWLYTGYVYETGTVSVTGGSEYIDEQRDVTLKWRGSKNQRVIDISETLKQNKIVLYCD